jgi:hypothetical protein
MLSNDGAVDSMNDQFPLQFSLSLSHKTEKKNETIFRCLSADHSYISNVN